LSVQKGRYGATDERTTAAVASAMARSSSVGTTKTWMADDGVEITRGSLDR